MINFFLEIQEKNKFIYNALIFEIKQFIDKNSEFYNYQSEIPGIFFSSKSNVFKQQEKKLEKYLSKSFKIDLIKINHSYQKPHSILIFHELENSYVGLAFCIKDINNIKLNSSYLISKDVQFAIKLNHNLKYLTFEFKYYNAIPTHKEKSTNKLMINQVPSFNNYMFNEFVESDKRDLFENHILYDIYQKNTQIKENPEKRNNDIKIFFDNLLLINATNIDNKFKYEILPNLLLSNKNLHEFSEIINLTYDLKINFDLNIIDFDFQKELLSIEKSFKIKSGIFNKIIKKLYI